MVLLEVNTMVPGHEEVEKKCAGFLRHNIQSLHTQGVQEGKGKVVSRRVRCTVSMSVLGAVFLWNHRVCDL